MPPQGVNFRKVAVIRNRPPLLMIEVYIASYNVSQLWVAKREAKGPVVMVSPSPARDSPRDYTPTADIPLVESANTPEDPWWDWQAEEDPHVQESVWAAIEALEDNARVGRLLAGVTSETRPSTFIPFSALSESVQPLFTSPSICHYRRLSNAPTPRNMVAAANRHTKERNTRAQTLAIAWQKCLDNMLGGPSVDPGAGHIDPETTRNGGSFPNVGLNNSVDIDVDNSPPVLSDPLPLEDPGNGADHNDLSDGSDELDDLLEQTALQRMTLYRHKKARKVLASEGFLDIRSFMELKEREREERERSSNTSTTADWTMSGGPMEENEDDNEIIVLLGPVDHARYRGGNTDEGSDIASDVKGPVLVAPT
ncbi:hypothetical protein EDB85DRAFT_1900623 [Lactarius pseudohatsudake]|nr:hypothetical protein EDB85DRAFT_1900623 [Lactarius pseudohatsudake]